jgi:hypothetical protein
LQRVIISYKRFRKADMMKGADAEDNHGERLIRQCEIFVSVGFLFKSSVI